MRVTQPRARRLGRRTGVGAGALSFSAAGLAALWTGVGTSFHSDPPAAAQPAPDTAAAALRPQVIASFRSAPLPSSFPVQVHTEPERKGTAVAAPLRLCGPGLGRTVPLRPCLSPGEGGKVTRSHPDDWQPFQYH
ncbi:hypothetical protein NN561_001032 [Cricetulus griseus]